MESLDILFFAFWAFLGAQQIGQAVSNTGINFLNWAYLGAHQFHFPVPEGRRCPAELYEGYRLVLHLRLKPCRGLDLCGSAVPLSYCQRADRPQGTGSSDRAGTARRCDPACVFTRSLRTQPDGDAGGGARRAADGSRRHAHI